VFRNENGGFKQVISLGLQNFKDATGAWQKIDNTLVADSAGGWRNAAGPLAFDLPAVAGPIRVDSPLGSLTMRIRGGEGSPLAVSSNSASYGSILPGIDAMYSVISGGLDENLILRDRPNAPLAITYDLTTDGLILSLAQDGTVTATGANGTFAFKLPAPWMMEAPGGRRATTSSPTGPTSRGFRIRRGATRWS